MCSNDYNSNRCKKGLARTKQTYQIMWMEKQYTPPYEMTNSYNIYSTNQKKNKNKKALHKATKT